LFPIDFVIMEMEEDFEVPVILRRPFLATAKALIDMAKGRLILRIQDEEVIFDISKSMKYPPSSDDSCFRVDVIEEAISEVCQDSMSNNQLEIGTVTDEEDKEDEQESEEQVNYLDNNNRRITYEEIERTSTPNTKPFVEEPPTLELKPLSQNL